MNRSIYFGLLILFIGAGCASTGKTAQSPTTESRQDKKTPYQKVVNAKTQTDEGLFVVHRNKDEIYYEIPDSLLGREMIWISRISALPAEFGGGYMNAGSKTNEMVVRWEKKFDVIYLRSVSHSALAPDSVPISKSVVANNLEPILYSFKIEARNPDSTATLIRVDNLFTKDIPSIGPLNSYLRKNYQVRRLDDNRSFIEYVKSFPLNIEVRHELTFEASQPPSESWTGTISVQMNQSMILLSDELMEKRPYDNRVDWFSINQINYGSEALKADARRYIRKWKLVPSDPEAYARGELVEPVKPIVYYLDPATPTKWRPYFKEGIELWQQAFETAGFKNAIIAKDPPSAEEDPDFSPEDVRYSVVRYVASTTRNATGPSVSDPRTGEIIESDIIWYHNHLRSYRNRYLLETGAANPGARTLNTPDAEIGEMMKMVIAHEVGHALGLPHNMKASAAYPVDSLRSGTFTQEYGIAATIMDYARYNYIAQPGDENIRFIRQLGPYDHYAINWGYRYLPPTLSEAEKKKVLSSWVREKEGDTKFMFGNGRGGYDPTSQTEGIGDDPVRASEYGLKNLKYVADNLLKWTTTPGENYTDFEELYGEMIGVWGRYNRHVIPLIGGVVETRKTSDQEGPVYTPVSAADQKRAVSFILNNSFDDINWLVSGDMMNMIEPDGALARIEGLQSRILRDLFSVDRINRMSELQTLDGVPYGAADMMKDIRNGIWKELRSSNRISSFRRNLQRAHVEQLSALAYSEESEQNRRSLAASSTDAQAIARAELLQLKKDIQSNRSRITDTMSIYHLEDIVSRINDLMEAR